MLWIRKIFLIMLSLSVILRDRQDGRVNAEKNWITILYAQNVESNIKKERTA